MIVNNYHTHTLYCDGKDTPQALVDRALELGCTELGFSGHSYTEFDPGYCMSPAKTQEYKAVIRALQAQYKGRLRIYLGIEQDYYSRASTEGYDYVIGSVHYVKKDGEYLSVDESRQRLTEHVSGHYGGDIYGFIEDYYATVGDIWRKTRCQIIGHFDLVTKFNADGTLFDVGHPRYVAAVKGALEQLSDCPAAFEINTGGMARSYTAVPYPAESIVSQLRKMGKQLIFSSDCHRAEQLLYGYEAYERLISETAASGIPSK